VELSAALHIPLPYLVDADDHVIATYLEVLSPKEE
jgi:hypothetical protein